jgi:hypothetical protein
VTSSNNKWSYSDSDIELTLGHATIGHNFGCYYIELRCKDELGNTVDPVYRWEKHSCGKPVGGYSPANPNTLDFINVS